jgi:hypothetical protein
MTKRAPLVVCSRRAVILTNQSCSYRRQNLHAQQTVINTNSKLLKNNTYIVLGNHSKNAATMMKIRIRASQI